ncbi:MAG TPA: hypothetical protein DD412_07775 [Holosporales bacterium]|nr:hypothetical protein [Holosporales bacterium]
MLNYKTNYGRQFFLLLETVFYKQKIFRQLFAVVLGMVFIVTSFSPAQAHLQRRHVCDAYAQTKAVIIIEPRRVFKDREHFFKVMAMDKNFAVAYTRCIGRAVDRFSLVQSGFRLQEGRDELNKFVLKLHAPLFEVTKQPISLTNTYNSVHSFAAILAGTSKKEVRYSDHTVMFRSFSGNILLIPRQEYISIYDFAKKASFAEIVDLWRQTGLIAKELKTANKPFTFATHAGTASGQTVPHFHLRFEMEK